MSVESHRQILREVRRVSRASYLSGVATGIALTIAVWLLGMLLAWWP